jgi:hypothetical protein
MKRLLFISLFILTFLGTIFSQESGYGVGVMLGEPTGISGKYWLDNTTAIDLGIATGIFGENTGFSIHTDYLYQIDNLLESKYKIPFYYGFGLRIRFPQNSQMQLGVRGTAGLLMYLKNLPIDVFFEIAPSFRLLPTTGLDFDIAIGSRYYFAI